MKLLIALMALVFTATSAHAEEQLSLFGGLNTTEFDGGGNWDRKFGFEFGATYISPLQGNLSLRTGAGIVQKNSEFSVTGFSRDVDFMFLEIPATLMFTVNNQWNLFGGLNLDITLADDGAKSESFALNLPLGARCHLKGPHSLEAILELGITDIIDSDVKIGNSLSFRYLYDFSVHFK